MRAVIIEDEFNSAQALETMLKAYCPNVTIEATYESVADARRNLPANLPDIIFLDIKLTDGIGFEVLEQIDYSSTQIIFTTAYNEFALKAIKFSALDYLLKPISLRELISSVEKAQRQLQKKADADRVKLLMQNINSNHKFTQIALPTGTGYNFIEIKDIIRFEAEGSYTNVYYLPKEKTLVTKQLKEFEHLLEHETFFRTHHSHLVNLKHIKKYVKGTGGYLVMNDGSTADVAARRKEELLKVLNIH